MAGFPAEADAPVRLGTEVTAVEPVAVEVDEPPASRALARHALALGLDRFMARLRAALCVSSSLTSRG